MNSEKLNMETVDDSSIGSTFSEAARKRRNAPYGSDDDSYLEDSINSRSGDDDKKKEKTCNLVAFWLLGLCNNYAYVVMLSAAYDILETKDDSDGKNKTSHDIIPINPPLYNLTNSTSIDPYECTVISTGAVLLADILPTLIIKLTSPWFADRIPYDIRVAFCILTGVTCFVLVSLSQVVGLTLLGVVFASISGGLGEFTFISLTSYYHKNVVSTYSSGTGAAGLFGALSYAGLTMILSPRNTLLVMLVIPVLEGISFWVILDRKTFANLPRPSRDDIEPLLDNEPRRVENKLSVDNKLQAIKPLLKYIIPLILVYYAEYVINQGLFELIYFPGIWLSHSEQYRWYQVDYQLAVFISRSSVNLIQFKRLWIFAVLQFVNLAILMSESTLHFLPNIWIMFLIVFFEGLLGGTAFVNTFYRISQESSPKDKEFSMGVTTISDSSGITLAALSAIPLHNALCKA
ncbi:battenin-like [Amphiura filiformis]|uniref:battenin-like n=1 Tax=Amphiura filiformis TaxID=82378 RepID=UPI003B2110E9